jgi:MAP/microtubule affinity-regulating kinase
LNFLSPKVVETGNKSSTEAWQADLWAVGVLAFVLLSGKYPFKGSSSSELKYQISQGLNQEAFDSAEWKQISTSGLEFVKTLLNSSLSTSYD